MNADDVVVLQVDGQGVFSEHYLIGHLHLRKHPMKETPFYLDVVDNDQDRTTAFTKARKFAGGRDVFFTQRQRPGHLQDHYNQKPE